MVKFEFNYDNKIKCEISNICNRTISRDIFYDTDWINNDEVIGVTGKIGFHSMRMDIEKNNIRNDLKNFYDNDVILEFEDVHSIDTLINTLKSTKCEMMNDIDKYGLYDEYEFKDILDSLYSKGYEKVNAIMYRNKFRYKNKIYYIDVCLGDIVGYKYINISKVYDDDICMVYTYSFDDNDLKDIDSFDEMLHNSLNKYFQENED